MDDQDRQRDEVKLAAAAKHTALVADRADEAVELAGEKVEKARDRLKDAEGALVEAKRTAKDARAEANDYQKRYAAVGTRANAGTAAASGEVA